MIKLPFNHGGSMLGVSRETVSATQMQQANFFKDHAAALITGVALFAISLVVIALCAHNQSALQQAGQSFVQPNNAWAIGVPVALVGSVAIATLMIYAQTAKKSLAVTPLMGVTVAAPAFTMVKAPLDAHCVALNVKVGDSVSKGTVLGTLEAMKMEIVMRAPKAGKVVEIIAQTGTIVSANAPLVRIE
jgi:biotin carboxyl carrier protein